MADFTPYGNSSIMRNNILLDGDFPLTYPGTPLLPIPSPVQSHSSRQPSQPIRPTTCTNDVPDPVRSNTGNSNTTTTTRPIPAIDLRVNPNHSNNVVTVVTAPRVEVPRFGGYSSENPRKFLDEFNSYVIYSGLQHDPDRIIAALHLHLRGPALVWFSQLPGTIKSSWETFHHAFTTRFIVSSPLDPALIAECSLWDRLVLLPHQALEDFHSIKGTRLEKPERDLLTKFINGLPEKLAFFVRAAHCTSFADALAIAKTGEAYGYRTPPPQISHIPPPQRAVLPSDPVEQLRQEVNGLRLMLAQTQSHPPSDNAYRCYKCGALGHSVRLCNWQGQGNNHTDLNIQCQLCSQFGHLATDCSMFNSTSSGNLTRPGQGRRVPSGEQ